MSDKTSDKLLPCPFCKEELEIVGNGHYYAHKINGCILKHLCFECDDVEAIKLWNTRKPMERIEERLEELIDFHSRVADYEMNVGTISEMEQHKKAIKAIDKAIEIVKEEVGWETQ